MACAAAALGACAHRPGSGDDAPTLFTLEGKQVAVTPDAGVVADEDRKITAYRDFVKASPHDPQIAEAMRRLGDLEMSRAERRADTGAEGAPGGAAGSATPGGAAAGAAAPGTPSGAGAASAGSAAAAGPAAAGPDRPATGSARRNGDPTYGPAISRYKDLLAAYPSDPGNDRVLYQLAHAYEQAGDLQDAMDALDRLVREYPKTPYRDEAQFRRGELMFATRDYAGAEQAYAAILHSGSPSLYFERALYMQGWTQFKQGRLEDALHSFFGVLDVKLIGRKTEGSLAEVPGLTRGDRELVEDTFRVVSLCLENLKGAESIPGFAAPVLRRDYEVRVYEQLGDLYLKQQRYKDAADTFSAFVKRNPLHPQAPVLQARAIEIVQQAGFESLALEAKKDYVTRYGADSEFRRASPGAWERAQPSVKADLAELARHYHAAAQKSKQADDYEQAVHWYRAYLDSFPSDPQAAPTRFLLAELLFERRQYDAAAAEYERSAYGYPHHAHSADAGYAALLCYAEQEKGGGTPEAIKSLQLAGIDSALRFAHAFPHDPRTGPVLSDAADKLYALHDGGRAADVAQEVLILEPPAAAAQRRVAWTVIAYTSFERSAFDGAEHGFKEVLKLTPENDPRRAELTERLAASIYKQGEQARAEGRLREAVGHFERVAAAAPQSPVRATAQYDAAAVLIGLKDWPAAIRVLEDFRARYPGHPLQDEVPAKLALAYSENKDLPHAAAEFERLAASKKDPQLAREAQWQAAELYEKAGARAPAAQAYERYVRQNPSPLEAAIEARDRLARLAREQGDPARAEAWLKELLQAEQAGGGARTDRTRYLGASAALALSEPVFAEYSKVALVEPLKKQLKAKKAKMEDVLKAYAVAAEYGVADIATAATYRTAELYHDFGRALLASQRPKGLSKDELEQYDVMLEEQAFPFEEKAIELHEVNARRSAQGIYDQWVRKSFAALGELRPARYAKSERSEVAIDAIR
jgi:TolA-binding protein